MSGEETDEKLESSTSNATDSNDGATPQETAAVETPATAPDEAKAAPPPATSTPAKADDAGPDPVAEAIDFLTKKPEAPPSEAKADEKEAEKPASQPEAKEPKVEAEKAPAPDNLDSDPYSGFSDEQRQAFKGKTKERIEELHHRWKDAETAAATGREIERALVHHKADSDLPYVSGDQLAGLTKAQAAVNRVHLARSQGQAPVAADLFVAQQFLTNLQAIGSDLGISAASTQTGIEPHKGELPQELKDLVEIYGVPEADVRLLAAVKNLKTAPAKAPAAPPAASQPQVPALPDMRPPAEPPPSAPDPVLVAYGRKTLMEFSKSGITQEKAAEHLNKTLDPILRRVMAGEFPGTTKDEAQAVFQSLSPGERHRIVVQAHQEWAKQQKPPSPPKPPPASTHRGLNGRGRGPANAPDLTESDDPVADAVRFMSR